MTYAIHPACSKWPRPPEAEFKALVADIKAKGLLNPIWLTAAGEILEGKTRYEACREADVIPHFATYTGDDPIGFTISQNKLRRHMTPAQLALIGEELALLQHGTNRFERKVDRVATRSTPETQTKIAEQLGISPQSIGDARALKKYAEPHIVELVRTNQVGLKNASSYARHTSREEQRGTDCKTIKQQGRQLRTPLKNGITGNRRTPTAKRKETSGTKFSPEQMRELNEKLRPFIKRLRIQSKKHIVEFSPYALECIAFDMDKLLENWANAGDAGRQTQAPPVSKTSGDLGVN